MKQRKEESEGDVFESMAEVVPRSLVPPPPPPLPNFFSKPKAEESVTNREIAKFWRQKRIQEEDHLLAAIKAAARLRARNLTVIINYQLCFVNTVFAFRKLHPI